MPLGNLGRCPQGLCRDEQYFAFVALPVALEVHQRRTGRCPSSGAPSWTCRKGGNTKRGLSKRRASRDGESTPRSLPGATSSAQQDSKNPKKRSGRGRGAKRAAVYDARAVYFEAWADAIRAELLAEQAEFSATQKQKLNEVADFTVTRTGRVYGQAVYTLERPGRGQRITADDTDAKKGDLVFISPKASVPTQKAAREAAALRDSDASGNPTGAIGDDDRVEASVFERTPWTIKVMVPVGSSASRSLGALERNQERGILEQGTSARAHDRALAALQLYTAVGREQDNPVVDLILKTFAERYAGSSEDGSDMPVHEETGSEGGSSGHPSTEPPSRQAVSAYGSLETPGEDTHTAEDAVAPPAEAAARAKPPQLDKGAVISAARPLRNGSLPDQPSGSRRGDKPESSPGPLNRVQVKALNSALTRTLSLIQGPPGTGKTQTAARIVVGAAIAGLGPVLAVAASNVAVDNLLEKIVAIDGGRLKVLRVGQVAAVKEDLWKHTLDHALEKDPKVRDARIAADKNPNATKAAREAEDAAAIRFVKGAHIVLSTCVGTGREVFEQARFRFVLCDEATQATEPDTLIALAATGGPNLRQLVLVGDHHQLPPTVLSDNTLLQQSLFSRLWHHRVQSTMLDTQYRMHPDIAAFPAQRFYFGNLGTAVKPWQRPLPSGLKSKLADSLADSRVLFVSVRNGREQREREALKGEDAGEDERLSRRSSGGPSFINLEEASVVERILDYLSFSDDQCGIISPYAGQVRSLSRALASSHSGIEVSTVDGFQGREKDIIIFSAVRSNTERRVGFLADWRRLNVAITRARCVLIVVGSPDTLSADPYWRSWLNSAPTIAAEDL